MTGPDHDFKASLGEFFGLFNRRKSIGTLAKMFNGLKNIWIPRDIDDLFRGENVVRTLEELIGFNREHKGLEMPPGEETASSSIRN